MVFLSSKKFLEYF